MTTETTLAPGEELTRPADIDPFQEYEVRSLNAEYAGTSAGFTFRDGLAIVRPLARDADEDDYQARIDALTWMLNAGTAKKMLTESDEHGRPYTKEITGRAYSITVSGGPVTSVIKKKPV